MARKALVLNKQTYPPDAGPYAAALTIGTLAATTSRLVTTALQERPAPPPRAPPSASGEPFAPATPMRQAQPPSAFTSRLPLRRRRTRQRATGMLVEYALVIRHSHLRGLEHEHAPSPEPPAGLGLVRGLGLAAVSTAAQAAVAHGLGGALHGGALDDVTLLLSGSLGGAAAGLAARPVDAAMIHVHSHVKERLKGSPAEAAAHGGAALLLAVTDGLSFLAIEAAVAHVGR